MSEHSHPRYLLALRAIGSDGRPLVAVHALAAEAGLHPDLVARLLALGALDPAGGTTIAPRYARDAAARLARIVRLRRDLGVNYAGAVLACDLLARIDALEDRLARIESERR